MTEKSSGTGESNFHRAQLSQDRVTLIYTNPLLNAGYGREDIPEEVLPVWGKGHCHVGGVYQPPQENLPCVTGAVPYIQIL